MSISLAKYYPIGGQKSVPRSELNNFHAKFSMDLANSGLSHDIKRYFGVSKAGILVQNAAMVDRCRELGYTFVALGSDGGAVNAGLRQYASVLKAAKR